MSLWLNDQRVTIDRSVLRQWFGLQVRKSQSNCEISDVKRVNHCNQTLSSQSLLESIYWKRIGILIVHIGRLSVTSLEGCEAKYRSLSHNSIIIMYDESRSHRWSIDIGHLYPMINLLYFTGNWIYNII